MIGLTPLHDSMRRHGFGLFAIAFLTAAIGLHFSWGSSNDNSLWVTAVCARVGVLLGAIWLALPQLAQVADRTPPWFAGGAVFVGLITAIRPRWIIYILPLLAAMAVLQFWGWLFKPLANPKRKTNRTKPD